MIFFYFWIQLWLQPLTKKKKKKNWKLSPKIQNWFGKHSMSKARGRFFSNIMAFSENLNFKVKKILKGSLGLVLTPSVKIQIWAGKFSLGVKVKHCWALSTNFWKQKGCWHQQQCFALLPQVHFPTNNLNFQFRWRHRIKAIFLNLFYFNQNVKNDFSKLLSGAK